MGYEFKCDNCRGLIRVKWLKPGEPALCRSCGRKMAVPDGAASIDNSLADSEPAEQGAPPAQAAASPEVSCLSCRWLGKPGAFALEAIGTCRRFPPSHQGWPGVSASDWCGEHFPKQ